MVIKLSDFEIKGIDVSQFNGTVDFQKVKESGIDFCGIRVGYGNTMDSKFKENWANGESKVLVFPYWYLDYYSNHIKGTSVYGMADMAWGKKQAQNCHSFLPKGYKTIVFLDVENVSSSIAPPISEVADRVRAIITGFIIEIDELNKRRNGFYLSFGNLTFVGNSNRTRPLWMARYTDAVTQEQMRTAVNKLGWTDFIIWQYDSNGDIDGDGTGDGNDVGVQSKSLDLNGWMASIERYEEFSGESYIPPEPPQPPEELEMLFQIKCIVSSLNVRSGAGTNYPVVGNLSLNQIANVYAIDTLTGWYRLDDGTTTSQKWCSNNPLYVTTIIPPPVTKLWKDMTIDEKLEALHSKHPDIL